MSGFFAFDGKKTRPGIGAVLRLPSSITEHMHPTFERLESPNPSNAVHILEGGPQVPEKKQDFATKKLTNGQTNVQSKVKAVLQRPNRSFQIFQTCVQEKPTHDVKDRFADELDGFKTSGLNLNKTRIQTI